MFDLQFLKQMTLKVKPTFGLTLNLMTLLHHVMQHVKTKPDLKNQLFRTFWSASLDLN